MEIFEAQVSALPPANLVTVATRGGRLEFRARDIVLLSFAPVHQVKRFLRRAIEAERCGAGAPSQLGRRGEHDEPAHHGAGLVIVAAWRAAQFWWPRFRAIRTSPAETWGVLDFEHGEARIAAASWQLKHCRAGWTPKQRQKEDSAGEAKARVLWATADNTARAADRLWNNAACIVAIDFLGIMLALAAVEDETFQRYVESGERL